MRIGRRTISVTNLDKVLFPGDGITKGDLIDYYAAIAPVMLPFVRDRPLTMERYPDGIESGRIFQKAAPRYFPDWVTRVTVSKKGGVVEHPVVDSAASLVYLANQACITHHVWLSTTSHLERADQMIFDLDPSREDFDEVRATALRLRELLGDAGLVPFVKSTGSRGLHVTVPLRPAEEFGVVARVGHAIAAHLAAERPDTLTMEFFKADRGGRIFLDMGRNAYAQTVVAPFTVRPLPGAPVAVPLAWEEVGSRRLRPAGFGMRETLRRAEGPDPWDGFRRSARSIRAAAKRFAVDLALRQARQARR